MLRIIPVTIVVTFIVGSSAAAQDRATDSVRQDWAIKSAEQAFNAAVELLGEGFRADSAAADISLTSIIDISAPFVDSVASEPPFWIVDLKDVSVKWPCGDSCLVESSRCWDVRLALQSKTGMPVAYHLTMLSDSIVPAKFADRAFLERHLSGGFVAVDVPEASNVTSTLTQALDASTFSWCSIDIVGVLGHLCLLSHPDTLQTAWLLVARGLRYYPGHPGAARSFNMMYRVSDASSG
jgi:hypothetical protein